MDVADQWVIVTGATGGMGSAIARSYAHEGRRLILSDLNMKELKALASDLPGAHSAQLVAGDVADSGFLGELLAIAADSRIGVIAHAAGVSPSMANGKRIFEINFRATKALVEASLPRMADGGAIVLIASNSGQIIARPVVDRAIIKVLHGRRSLLISQLLRSPRTSYPISKRAVQLLAEKMAVDCGKLGVRIVSLSPGMIDTDMGRLEQKGGPHMDRMLEITPMRRMGYAEEVASVVSFLTSPGARYITGTDILVDGGTVAGIRAAGGPVRALR